MAKSKKTKTNSNDIAQNRKARFEYQIDSTYEAGLSLLGWEVKSLRAGRVQLADCYVLVRQGEAFLLGCHISPMHSASTHVNTDPQRLRKLLLHRKELNTLIGQVERKGYTLVPLSMYWVRGKVKLKIGLGKGKREHDKRAASKERDWSREKNRLLRRT